MKYLTSRVSLYDALASGLRKIRSGFSKLKSSHITAKCENGPVQEPPVFEFAMSNVKKFCIHGFEKRDGEWHFCITIGFLDGENTTAEKRFESASIEEVMEMAYEFMWRLDRLDTQRQCPK